MSDTDPKLPPGEFASESEREKYEMNPANFDKLPPATQARVAVLKYNSGQPIGVAETKIIEASIPGADGDGFLSQKERQALIDMRDDKNFLKGMGQVGNSMMGLAFVAPELTNFNSVGGVEIGEPSVSLTKEFGTAAVAKTPATEPAAQHVIDDPEISDNDANFTDHGAKMKGANGAALALNKFTPAPPSNF